MVKIKESAHLAPDGTINLEAWLQHATGQRSKQDMQLIRHASVLTQLTGEEKPALTGISCLQQGLTMAEILLDLELDKESIAAALVYNAVRHGDLSLEDVKEHLGDVVAKLVRGTIQMDAIGNLPSLNEENHAQLENTRKMLLAMVEDMRVVIIKLAERTTIMRFLGSLDEKTAKQIARETMDIYAPLANRLGIGQLKWELEDRSLRYIDPKAYLEIANNLQERRIERASYIENIVRQIKEALQADGLTEFDIAGRAKHIYSIYRKMRRKKLPFQELYDLNAVRILVNSIEDCYKALSIIHGLWQPIAKEFDDYIATPKPNGYRSIHTVIVGPHAKNIEVQIRTHTMHQESEHGIAAHWRYKEGGQQKAGYEAKIAWLRQVLAWQKEMVKTGSNATPDPNHASVLDDRVYIFTPTSEILEMPHGSTPLDFAYYIHSEVGNRCRGAKVNGTIVPLTYTLTTGEQVEILTSREPNPSRDWLNPHLGYLKTARAKAKVHHWFKLQDYDKNFAEGQLLLERELQRLAIQEIDHEKIAAKLHFKNSKDMLAALGCGDLRMAQILGAIQIQIDQAKKEQEFNEPIVPIRAPSKTPHTGINIAGVDDLLTHPARCCKPVPGEPIMGFITRGRGVAIHRKDCLNLLNLTTTQQGRLIEVDWGMNSDAYPVDIIVEAIDRSGLVRDVTTIISNEKINIVALTTRTSKAENMAQISLTIEIPDLTILSKVFDKLKHMPNVIAVRRQVAGK